MTAHHGELSRVRASWSTTSHRLHPSHAQHNPQASGADRQASNATVSVAAQDTPSKPMSLELLDQLVCTWPQSVVRQPLCVLEACLCSNLRSATGVPHHPVRPAHDTKPRASLSPSGWAGTPSL
eukprot:1986865-Amphidinium_carterae.1